MDPNYQTFTDAIDLLYSSKTDSTQKLETMYEKLKKEAQLEKEQKSKEKKEKSGKIK
jgi:hypothetical protein